MSTFEERFIEFTIAGVDEAGRGPLAGPVVAGCVVLDRSKEILYVNDSKKLSEKKRNELYDEIIEKACAYGVGIVDEKIIDEINILEATHIAMKKAYEEADKMYKERFGKNINMLFVDALKIKKVDIKQVSIVHGDALSISVASASIIAKVTRDRMMIEYDKKYPEYGFAKHKGYGTKAHIDAIKKYGVCELHRKSFVKNFS
ncbi:MAG: ribonuclease HII [Lachnospiraceae bacterium]|nr:ribonuclease HII [Lachnospiraceae bacterium]